MKEIYKIWFSSLDLKNSTKLELLEKFTEEEIWHLDFVDLLDCFISEQEIIRIVNHKNLDEEKRVWEYMQKKKMKLLSVKDKMYPHKLHWIDDKPAFLYVRGDETILDDDAVRNGWLSNGK